MTKSWHNAWCNTSLDGYSEYLYDGYGDGSYGEPRTTGDGTTHSQGCMVNSRSGDGHSEDYHEAPSNE